MSCLAACSEQSLPKNANGKQLFEHYCSECHNKSGKGDFLSGIPANKNTQMTERQIIRLIRYGKADKPNMPTFSQISQQDATLIAGYLVDQL